MHKAFLLIHLIKSMLLSFMYTKDAPSIYPKIINQTVDEKDEAYLTCQATGTPIPNISWYFNGAQVDYLHTMKYFISEMLLNPITINSTLIIASLELSDMGTYTCTADNVVSSDTSSGVLTVKG